MSVPSESPLQQLAHLAARRHGVVTTREAAELGVTPAQLRTQIRKDGWRRAGRGVLIASGAPRCWKQDVAVASLELGAVASHRCAARLHRLDGFGDAPVELTLARSATRRTRGHLVHWTESFDDRLFTIVSGIRTTSVARTLVDLGAVVDDDLVEQALDDAMRRKFNLRWITETLASVMRPGPTGCGALQRVLARSDRQGPIPDSMFERLVERLATSHGLPRPDRQVPVVVDGRTVARIDAAWPERMVGLEADSELWHWGPRRGRLARMRHNQLTALGWEMLYSSWQDIDDPADLVSILRRCLQTHL